MPQSNTLGTAVADQATTNEILGLISGFESGDFSKRLKSTNGNLKPIVDRLNSMAETLAAQSNFNSLKMRKQELRTAFETLSDGIVIQDSDAKILQFNPAALSALGLTEDEILGRTSLDPRWNAIREDGTDFPGDEHPAMVALRTGRKVVDMVMGIEHPPGGRRWLRVNATPYESKGNPEEGESPGRHVIVTFSDITRLKKVEAQALEHLTILESVVENIPVAVFLKDAGDDFRIKLWNKAAEEIFEIPRAAVLGKTTRELWPKEQADLFTADDEKVAKDGVLVDIPEEPSQTKTRGTIYLHTKRLPLEIGASSKYQLSICDDITEQKNAQVKSREQSAFVKMIADRVPGMLAYWTADLKCAFANRAYFEWFGKTSEQMQGIRIQDLMGPDLFQKNEAFIRGALRGDEQEFERSITKPNGELSYTWAKYSPHYEDEKILGFFVLISDITPLKREQMRTAKSLAKWESLFSLLPVGVSILDEEGKIRESNLALKSMFSLRTEKLALGTYRERKFLRRDGTAFSKEEFPSAIAARTQALSGPVEIGVALEDGSTVWTEVTAAPLDLDDAACVVVSQNITERINLQKQLEQQRSALILSNKLASLGELSAGVAHEINNPLGIIAGIIPLLKKFKNDEAKFASKTEALAKATSRIEKIVKGLKKFSRSSEVSVFKIVSLREIIHDSILILDSKSKQQNTVITVEMAESLEVSCDEVEIQQVLINLIGNSIDALKTQEDKWVKIKAFNDDGQTVLQVIDSGLGISLEIEQRLFQPFFTTKPTGEGTGLGLSISNGILEQHKATLILNRTFANTCFEIRFQGTAEVKSVI